MTNDDTPRLPLLATLEFQPAGPPEDVHADAARWLQGDSEAVARLRERAAATATDGFAAAVVSGPPGSGRLRTAQWVHRRSRRSDRPLLVLDATAPEARVRIDGLAAALGPGASPNPAAAGVLPGNIAIRDIEHADEATITALADLLTAQGLELRCGLLLVTAAPLAELRARSLAHGQLFARCARAIVQVPPLARRSADVPALARTFLLEATRRYGRSIRGVSPQALTLLQSHAWPGNVRELQATVEQAVLAGSTDWLTVEDFPRLAAAQAGQADDASRRGELVIRLPGSSLRDIELQALRLALELTGGRIVRAAELLGITRHALRRKLEKHGLTDLRRGPNVPAPRPREDSDAYI